MAEIIWEQLDPYHQRAKVPGGWLVKSFNNVVHIVNDGTPVSGWDWRTSMTFVPDPNHDWK